MRQGAAEREFTDRLRTLGLRPRRENPWLLVGKPTRVAGWKLHVSATATGVERLFEQVLPCLVDHRAHFKMAADRDAIVKLSDGLFGESQIGKVITVYPRSDAEAVLLARELIVHTRGIAGPVVATDLHLGEAVYARYGSVRPRIVRDRFGKATELIPDGSGNWIPDLRPVPFKCPPGIASPFSAVVAARQAARRDAREPDSRELLIGRYFVTDVLRPKLSGSVLRAIDLHNAAAPTVCVLKQARAHCSADALGRDYRVRLRHEGAVLARLRGLKGVAPAGEYFEDEGTGYLPLAYVPGQTLAELVYRQVTGRSWRRIRAPVRRCLLRHAQQLVYVLSSAHARGVIHRDVSPRNVWIGDDDQVYLLDWESAHIVGSRMPAFRRGTAGFSDLSREPRRPARRDDWQACGRVLTFMLTGLDPAAVIHGRARALARRLAELTELSSTGLIELLAQALADEPTGELDAAMLLRTLGDAVDDRTAEAQHRTAPLFTMAEHESVLAQGLELLTVRFRVRLDRLQTVRTAHDAAALDAHSGIAGLLYMLAAAHRARVAELDSTLAARAASLLMPAVAATADLPGLVHGRAGRALAVAAAVQAECISADDALRTKFLEVLPGRLDWPDLTHGAAGQGLASLACAQRLRMGEMAPGAAACASYLLRTQSPEGAWTLPEGVAEMSGERQTGFAHGTAGIMAFLGCYAARSGDAAADAAWRRAEAWLISRARRGRGAGWQWPQSDSRSAPSQWWCHGAPGIALGGLCVAQARGTASVAQEYLRGALEATPAKLRSDSLGQCHGLAGIGEIYLEAHRVLCEECWRERAADLCNVLVALFRKRSRHWHPLRDEPAAHSEGLMLGTAGILHFLLRHRHPTVVTSAPLLA